MTLCFCCRGVCPLSFLVHMVTRAGAWVWGAIPRLVLACTWVQGAAPALQPQPCLAGPASPCPPPVPCPLPAVAGGSRLRSFAVSADLSRAVLCKWDSTVKVVDLQVSQCWIPCNWRLAN